MNWKSVLSWRTKTREQEYEDSKIPRSSNRSAGELTTSLEPFEGSNLSASYKGNVYIVWSFNWYPIYVHKDGQWYENTEGRSISTKKHKFYARPDVPSIIPLGFEEIKELYE